MGWNSKVNGRKNRILVDNVVVQGNGGWVLKKCFQGKCEGDLIVGEYRINIDSLPNIKNDFGRAIQHLHPRRPKKQLKA